MLLFKSCLTGTIRGFCTKVDKPILSKLRKKTGFPIINCKNALIKFDNDFEKAEQWLQEQAQKEGWDKATKLQSRPMSQGLIGLVGDQKSATMIEVNCETDFVGKNMKFVELVTNLLKNCSNHCNNITANTVSYTRFGKLDKEEVNLIVTPEGKTVQDMVAYNVGNIGENMAIRRAVHVVASPQSQLYTYVHVSEGFENYQIGKYGTIVEIQQSADGNNNFVEDSEIKNGICQHIVGMNPKIIGELDDETPPQGDNEDRLLFQEYLLDSSVLVKDVVKDNDLELVDFVRFECGEVLPGDEE
ncbi:hypothetical protein LOTGIDRAFT_137823 [Lottia gigantea]|uniref:Elongation factor Ts, mitochondrial n=1 Tax=Lottia gigantea TaxID=225164 RepID=V4B6P7_LOTGI|nr:hypothetical protein LOTGIDRAFT_137823 [Lottia gigantea]ESP03196.1 hypothetical protein LOTGIDRAFT_137823 [Lottia gigantea]